MPAKNFTDFCNIEGHPPYNSIHEAATALGILNSEDEFVRALREITPLYDPRQIRRYFANILVFGAPSNPDTLFVEFLGDMIDPFYTNIRHGETEQQKADRYNKGVNAALYHLHKLLENHGRTMDEFSLPDYSAKELSSTDADTALDLPPVPTHLNGSRRMTELRDSLNAEQRRAYDIIADAVDNPGFQTCFFIQASGGCGKTHLYKSVCDFLIPILKSLFPGLCITAS